jgi:hypothetical protein
MKLGEYIKTLQKIVKENPKAKDYTVVYATDEEGNMFEEVMFHPTVGAMIEEDGESCFYTSRDDPLPDNFVENSVCVN